MKKSFLFIVLLLSFGLYQCGVATIENQEEETNIENPDELIEEAEPLDVSCSEASVLLQEISGSEGFSNDTCPYAVEVLELGCLEGSCEQLEWMQIIEIGTMMLDSGIEECVNCTVYRSLIIANVESGNDSSAIMLYYESNPTCNYEHEELPERLWTMV